MNTVTSSGHELANEIKNVFKKCMGDLSKTEKIEDKEQQSPYIMRTF